MQEKTVKTVKVNQKLLDKDNKHGDDDVTDLLLLVYFSSSFPVETEINDKA